MEQIIVQNIIDSGLSAGGYINMRYLITLRTAGYSMEEIESALSYLVNEGILEEDNGQYKLTESGEVAIFGERNHRAEQFLAAYIASRRIRQGGLINRVDLEKQLLRQPGAVKAVIESVINDLINRGIFIKENEDIRLSADGVDYFASL